jgi:lysine/ornithine N-monooxygenase
MVGEMEEEYDVMICGAGPTGVLLAAYLSRAGGVKVKLLRLALMKDPDSRENENNHNGSEVCKFRYPNSFTEEFVWMMKPSE